MSPRWAETVRWVPWRPPYAILSIAYGSRRPATNEAAPPTASWQSSLFPLAPSTFLRSGAPWAGRCKKNTCDGGGCMISPPPPPPCPPAWSPAEPRRARVKRVSIAHHEEGGGASDILREQSWFHRTKTSRPMKRHRAYLRFWEALVCRRRRVSAFGGGGSS